LLGDTLAALGKFKLVVLNRFPFSLSRPWRQWGADLPLHSFGEGGEPSAFRITLGSWGMHRSGWLRRSLEARRGAQVSGFDQCNHTTKTLGKVSVEHWCGLSHAKPNIAIWAKERGLLVNHKGARGGLDRPFSESNKVARVQQAATEKLPQTLGHLGGQPARENRKPLDKPPTAPQQGRGGAISLTKACVGLDTEPARLDSLRLGRLTS
jgi:hypothetical protein